MLESKGKGWVTGKKEDRRASESGTVWRLEDRVTTEVSGLNLRGQGVELLHQQWLPAEPSRP